jgi:hypothetical protein
VANATGVPLIPTIKVTFSEPVSNVTESTITWMGSNASTVTFSVTKDSAYSDSNVVYDMTPIEPTVLLNESTTYTITLESGIVDQNNTALNVTATSFTTGNFWVQINQGGSIPSARSNMATWIDASGNFYLFGGQNGNTYLNSMYVYTPSLNQWGSIASTANTPSSRGFAATWADENGNFYLFGGYGGSYLNDMHSFNYANSTWSSVAYTGTMSAIGGAGVWKDGSGNFYLFGGKNGSNSYANTLSEYNIANNVWATVTSSGTTPSAMAYFATWLDKNGNVYTFGGSNGTKNNNMFQFNLQNNAWSTITQNGDIPSPRISVAKWMDKNGNFYLFGGDTNSGVSQDMYVFTTSNATWKLINTEPSSWPPARGYAATWTDESGNFYLFGGYGGSTTYFNDLYKTNLY